MSLRGIFQTGYVTHDIDRAIRDCGPAFGAGEFVTMEIVLPLMTQQGAREMAVKVATAWVGGMQVELIQPLSGYVDTYLAGMPSDTGDYVPRFHHLAVRRDDLAAMSTEVDALGMPTVFETGGNGITSRFVDARAAMGHHLEFVCADAAGWAMLGWPDAS